MKSPLWVRMTIPRTRFKVTLVRYPGRSLGICVWYSSSSTEGTFDSFCPGPFLVLLFQFPVSTFTVLFLVLAWSFSFSAIALVANADAQLSAGLPHRESICATDCGSRFRPHGHYRRLIAELVDWKLASSVASNGLGCHGETEFLRRQATCHHVPLLEACGVLVRPPRFVSFASSIGYTLVRLSSGNRPLASLQGKSPSILDWRRSAHMFGDCRTAQPPTSLVPPSL